MENPYNPRALQLQSLWRVPTAAVSPAVLAQDRGGAEQTALLQEIRDELHEQTRLLQV